MNDNNNYQYHEHQDNKLLHVKNSTKSVNKGCNFGEFPLLISGPME